MKKVGTINYMSPEAITNPTGLGNKRGLKVSVINYRLKRFHLFI